MAAKELIDFLFSAQLASRSMFPTLIPSESIVQSPP